MLNQSIGSDHNLGTMFRYSVEKPMAGAMIMYNGRNPIVNAREPGIAKEGVAVSDKDIYRMTSCNAYRPRCILSKGWNGWYQHTPEAMSDRKFHLLRYKCSFPKHREKDHEVQNCAPHPMTRV